MPEPLGLPLALLVSQGLVQTLPTHFVALPRESPEIRNAFSAASESLQFAPHQESQRSQNNAGCGRNLKIIHNFPTDLGLAAWQGKAVYAAKS